MEEVLEATRSERENLSVAEVLLASDRVVVLRFPLAGSCAIPLSVVFPERLKLRAWAFLDFGDQAPREPSCLLIVEGDVGLSTLLPGRLTVRTHMRDLHLAVGPAPSSPRLSRSEASILARSALTALDSDTVTCLATVLSFLPAALDEIVPLTSGPELVIATRPGEASATGLDFIPAYLLVRTGGGYRCCPVRAVRIRATPRRTLTLTIDCDGREEAVLERAIFVGEGRFAAASRVIRA